MNTKPIRVAESNDLLEAFISNTPLGVIVIDFNGVIRKINNRSTEYLGISKLKEQVVNDNLLLLTEEIEEFHCLLLANLKTRQAFKIEAIIINDRYYTISGQNIVDGYIITIENISHQKELEANSIQAILESQENERRRLGREIHDGIGPILSFMKLRLDSFIDELLVKDCSIATDTLNDISETIDSLTVDLRLLSHNLVPRLLDEFGLSPAFENMVIRLNESKKANINLYTNLEKDQRLDHDIELNIFRCGQELLNNAVKYSKAANILVQVILHKDSIVLMVEDDGIGFEKDKLLLENFGIGLTNIDTRVRMLNGEFNIESAMGNGTVASVEIPL